MTSELSPARDNLSEVCESLPEQVKSAILALSILVDRIGSLSKADRDDLFELLNDWRKATDPEDQRSIRRAMEEVLAQVPLTIRDLPLPGPESTRSMSKRRKSWAQRVGSKIKGFREEARWTQMRLAKEAGLPQSHISRLENGEYSATNLTLEKIAKALGVSIGQIDPSAE